MVAGSTHRQFGGTLSWLEVGSAEAGTTGVNGQKERNLGVQKMCASSDPISTGRWSYRRMREKCMICGKTVGEFVIDRARLIGIEHSVGNPGYGEAVQGSAISIRSLARIT